MALIVRECLTCKENGKSALFECVTTIADQSCPVCGEDDKEKTPRDWLASLGDKSLIKLAGDIRGISEAEGEMEMRNKKYWEDNADRIRSGEITAKFPKNRPKEFDPSYTKKVF